MKRIFLVLLAWTFPLVASCTQPRDTYQPAQLRMEGSRVCFSINDTEESRKFPPQIAAVTVLKHTPASSHPVWAVDLTEVAPPMRVGPSQCVEYGARIPGALDLKEPDSLEPGQRYSVSINAFINAAGDDPEQWLNRRYRSDFCLIRLPNARLDVVVVPQQRGQPAWEVCPPLALG